MKTAVLLISHGSRSSKTKKEIELLIEQLKCRNDAYIFHYAFLEMESPSIPEGIDACIEGGGEQILVVLNFLNAGQHVDVDIPSIIQSCREKYPDVLIKMTKPVGQHPQMVELFSDLIKSA